MNEIQSLGGNEDQIFENQGTEIVFVSGSKVDHTVRPARDSIRRAILDQLAKEEKLRRLLDQSNHESDSSGPTA